MPRDDETISEGLKRLGYTHRKTDDSGAHAVEKDGRLVGYMHAHQAAALIEREDAIAKAEGR